MYEAGFMLNVDKRNKIFIVYLIFDVITISSDLCRCVLFLLTTDITDKDSDPQFVVVETQKERMRCCFFTVGFY